MKTSFLISFIFSSVLCFSQTDNNIFGEDTVYLQLISNLKEKVNAATITISNNKVQTKIFVHPKDTNEHFYSTTKTRIASIVKPMTAIAIMQLVEQGRLKLEDPIQNYLSDYKGEFKDSVTIRQVMSHTAGIPGYKNKQEKENKKQYPNLESAYHIFKNRDLLFKPGTAYSYSSYGYVLLGNVIEKVANSSYEKYMQKHIWKKADMKNTGIEVYGKKYKNKALLYHRNHKGKIQKAEANNLSDRIPGGGVYSTSEDLILFGEAVLDNKLISKESLNMMLEDPKVKINGNGYGLGWTLYGENPKLGYTFGHGGAQTGASNIFMLFPDKRGIIVILSNTSGANDTIGEVLLYILNIL